jgi:AcrR family transcriptional regulator
MNTFESAGIDGVVADSRPGVAGLSDQKKKRRRDRVFQAAVELFDRKGFAATTMKEIAGKSELAVGTLYNYFPSKNALLIGIMERKMEEMRQGNRRSIVNVFRTQKDARAIMESIFRLVFRGFFVFGKQTWIEIFRALFSADQDMEKGIRLDMEGIAMLEQIIRFMQKRGLVQSRFPAYSVAFNLYSIMAAQLMLYIFLPGSSQEDLYRGISAQLELIFDAIGGSRRQEPPLNGLRSKGGNG